MASYNDYYDSRPRQSRRHDSFTRPKENAYLEPTAGRRSDHRDRRTYDNRYSYPPPLAPDQRRRSRTRELRSPIRKRRSWPPAPTVESERSALAKEALPHGILKKASEDEIPSRGVVDQDPMIEDVPEYMNLHERRFVVFSDSEKEGKSSKGNLTPPTSEDERRRRGRAKRPNKLGLDIDAVAPEFEKRTSSPYAFTKPKAKGEMSYSGETYLSPDALTPPPSDSKGKRHARFPSASQPSSPRRDSARLSPRSRTGRDYFASSYEDAIDDDSDGSASSARGNRKSATYPRKQEEAAKRSPQTSIVDFGDTPPNGSSVRRRNLDSRRQTDSATSLPKPRTFEKSSRPSPLMAASALSDIDYLASLASPKSPRASNLTPPSQPKESGLGSRNVSPSASIASRVSTSPPPSRSPRNSEFHRETSGSTQSSHNSSLAGSRPATPPSAGVTARMPTLPPMPPNELDWTNMMAANASRSRATASKVPSRLSTSMRMDSMPEIPRHASTFPRAPSDIPYPLDDGPATPSVYMPSEKGYQYFPSKPNTLETSLRKESATISRAASPVPSSTLRPSARPELPSRHSFANVSPVESRQPPPFLKAQRPETHRQAPVNTVAPTKQEVEAMLAKGMPGCPRSEPVAGHDDWYTLIGAANLDFCPDCVSNVWERTIYRNCFRRSVPRDLSTKVQCAFSTPWIRLAWLLTLQQRKPDLTLPRDLSDIEQTSEPCPGSAEAVRSWYGLRDPDGLFVRDFQICYSDVRKLERLLPTLSGLFVRLPYRTSYDKKKCALRSEGNRFSLYLDKILDMNDKAVASRKLPDPMPFIDLVERKLRIRECERDNMLLGGLWHFIPSLPEFTVCEDCYEEIVEPEVMKGADVAMRFNRTMQPVYGEGIGSSCQLYSRRMRKVWRTAVKEGDVKYLARKTKERRDAELRLQDRYRDIIRRARRLDSRGSGSGSDEESKRLEKDLERISREWKERWE